MSATAQFFKLAKHDLPTRPDEALVALLNAFRESPSIALADAVRALSQVVSLVRPPLSEPSLARGALDERWTRLAKRGQPADVDRLLEATPMGTPAAVAKRLSRLARFPSDPRISAWIVAQVKTGALDLADAEIRDAALRVLWGMGDPTVGAALVALAADPQNEEGIRAEWCNRAVLASRSWGRVQRPTETEERELAAIVSQLEQARELLVARGGPLSFDEAEAKLHDNPRTLRDAARITNTVSSPVPDLTDAATALASGTAGHDVLAKLLSAWRCCRDPRIADAVDLASRALPRRAALAEKPQKVAHDGWLAVAGASDPADVPRLLEGLLIGSSALITEKIEHLEKTRDDPRVSEGLVRLIEVQPFSATSAHAAYSAAFRLLVALGDDRVTARLNAVAAALPESTLAGGRTFRERIVHSIETTVTKLSARKRPPLEDAALALLDRLRAGLGAKLEAQAPAQRTEDELLAAVWAAPDEDGPRLVYADWLLERGSPTEGSGMSPCVQHGGSPRGELIVLQISGNTDAAAIRAERALLAKHSRAFLGPLEPAIVPSSARFERGFVAHCEIVARAAPAVDALAAHPAWATVKTFVLAAHHAPERARLVAHLESLGAQLVPPRRTGRACRS